MKPSTLALLATIAALALPQAGFSQLSYSARPVPAGHGSGCTTCIPQAGCASAAYGYVSDEACSACCCPDPYSTCYCSDCRGWSMWGSVDYLMWWGKGRAIPPLVTTSPFTTPRERAGVLGFNPTQILLGDERIGRQMQSGGRVDIGTWLDRQETVGLGVRVFGLEGGSLVFDAEPTPNQILAQPFFNVLLNREDSLLVSFPGAFEGDLSVRSGGEFWSSEGYARILFDEGSNYRADLIVGYHYTRLTDRLTKRDAITSVDPASIIPVGTTFEITDQFRTRNEFNGAELGFQADVRRGRFTLSPLAKLSVGQMRQAVTINGSTVITDPVTGGSQAFAGGLFTQQTNTGQFERIRTAFIPEIGINLGVDLTCRLRATFGYTALWISDVALAGDQIDRAVNLSQAQGGGLVGPARPAFAFRTTDYWLQGMNFGLNWDF